ncbi:hypothetical protein CBM2615_A120156 [Cupriavidus taiwanensis]|uniref:Uncharacterized protein n=1 Tax=Cupriavidus taiwanensis TaxID=164546 RepID=A0A375DWM9_9BURK|nr:hypothetical protein [Cupriavidus taiwanensis]SOZ49330.1 hypothetical protein CBM2615_A120156 [Cupriavidus taiwanensis]SOZ49398.1 hypothetical protein CBM2614_A120154 [Cupriavidus taiwanensis]SOZ51997.1 hypothetical protein CBM2613_A110155 [Cupriavidus taiwanensis]SPA07164.1 hypothetical protein CBM2625_A90153 [Cupriavidus taiwanensis]
MSEIHDLPADLDVAAGLENRRGLWLRLVQHGNKWRLAVTVVEGSARRSAETTVPGDGFSLPQWFAVIDGASQWDEGAQGVLLAAMPKVLGAGIGVIERSLSDLNKGWDRAQRERAEMKARGEHRDHWPKDDE